MIFENHHFYNCKITLSDSTEYLVEGNWIHNNGLDNWQGWECDAGHNRISINPDLSVYGGQCENDRLGNLQTSWDILQYPTTCKRSTCTGCTDDLIIKKRTNL